MRRKVRIALRARRRIPVGHAGHGRQRPAVRKPLHEVGIADVGPAKRDQVGEPLLHRGFGRFERVATVADERPAKHAAKIGERHRFTELVEPKPQPVHDVEVADVQAVERGRRVQKLLAVVGRPHVVEHAVRGDPHAHAAAGPDLRDRRDHVKQKAAPLLDAAAVIVGAKVGLRLQKLVDEIAVGGVDLNAVEASSPGPGSGGGVVGHDGGHLVGLESTRRLVGLFADRGVDAVAADPHRGGRHGRSSVVEIAVRRSPHVPELQEDPAAASVHAVGDHPPGGLHGVGVDARRLQPAVGLRRDGGRLGHDQPGRRPLGVVLRHGRVGNAIRPGPTPGQWRHHHAVGEIEVMEAERLEQAVFHGKILIRGDGRTRSRGSGRRQAGGRPRTSWPCRRR